jgi:hypothetical protein
MSVSFNGEAANGTIHSDTKAAAALPAEGGLRPHLRDRKMLQMSNGRTDIGLLIIIENCAASAIVLDGDRLLLVLAPICAGAATEADHGVRTVAIVVVPIVVTMLATDAKADETMVAPKRMAVVTGMTTTTRNAFRTRSTNEESQERRKGEVMTVVTKTCLRDLERAHDASVIDRDGAAAGAAAQAPTMGATEGRRDVGAIAKAQVAAVLTMTSRVVAVVEGTIIDLARGAIGADPTVTIMATRENDPRRNGRTVERATAMTAGRAT